MIEFALAAALMAQEQTPGSPIVSNARPDQLAATFYILDPNSENCEELDVSSAHEDCYLTIADGRDLLVEFTFDESEWGENGQMTVRSPQLTYDASGQRQRCSNGCVTQTFDFETESFFYPSLDDINADGLQDIRIPLATQGMNSEYAILFGTEDGFTNQPWRAIGDAIVAAPQNMIAVHRTYDITASVEFFEFRPDNPGEQNIAPVQSIAMVLLDDEDETPCRLNTTMDAEMHAAAQADFCHWSEELFGQGANP